jgi:hypothetical protein
MAGVDFAPGVDDRDYRAAREILAPVARLFQAGPVAEAAQRVGTEPPEAA